MEKLSFAWHWTKQISGVVMVSCFCLYAIRCLVTMHIVTLPQWEKWFNEFVRHIFA